MKDSMTLCIEPRDLLWQSQNNKFVRMYNENKFLSKSPDESFKDECEDIVLGLGFSKNQFEALYKESAIFAENDRCAILRGLRNRCGLILAINGMGVAW